MLGYYADGHSAHAAVQLHHTGTGAWQDTFTCWDDTSRGNYGAVSDEKFSGSIAT